MVEGNLIRIRLTKELKREEGQISLQDLHESHLLAFKTHLEILGIDKTRISYTANGRDQIINEIR